MSSIAHALSTPAPASPRWLLFASLALNLFFVGIAAAMLIRSPAPPDRSVSARIERLAVTLPASDAGKLRGKFEANRAAVENARAVYDNARETIGAALRRDPFDAEALREAMTKARATRQFFDMVLQSVVASAAAEMSLEGRQKLGEWPPGSRAPNSRP